jgi:hypothetical protein
MPPTANARFLIRVPGSVSVRGSVFKPRQRNRDRVFAEDAVLADRAVTFVRQFAVVTQAKLDAVPVSAAYIGAKHTVTLFEARYGALVEIGFAPSESLQVSERLDFHESNDVV